MKSIIFFIGFAFMLLQPSSSASSNYGVIGQKDLTDTGALRNVLCRIDSATVTEPEAFHLITLTGSLTGERTSYWYYGKRHIKKAQPLAGVLVWTKLGKYKTRTDDLGRFALQLPDNSADTLIIRGRCMGDAAFGYSGKEIPLKNINVKKALNLTLKYWLRPGMFICPCF
ncbi:MAG: hypothetical protein JWO06_3848 [Bacteroidota bacterium]|nr:hypothetical protein [Bacteroidota bacterium]